MRRNSSKGLFVFFFFFSLERNIFNFVFYFFIGWSELLSKVGIIRACLRYFAYYKMIRFDIKNGGFWNLGPLGNLSLYFVIDIGCHGYHISLFMRANLIEI